MKYIVSGGAGFLGSHLCDELIKRDNEIICIDNLVTGNKENIYHLIENKKFKFVNKNVSEMLDFVSVDGIFHLASPTDPVKCKEKVVETIEANSTGTLNLLKYSREKNIPLLFTSSIRVFDYNINGCYADSKRIGEDLCKEFGAKIARMGNVYGSRMSKDDGRVIPTFIRKALHNEDITVWGNGSQVDTFCYYTDIIDGLCKFMFSYFTGVIEFGSVEVISIFDLADVIVKQCNSHSHILFEEGKMNSDRKIVDITKAKKLLNWYPQTNIQNGLVKMIKNYK
jgi:nucleoside-diphosphate-sugar epimerase